MWFMNELFIGLSRGNYDVKGGLKNVVCMMDESMVVKLFRGKIFEYV